VTSIRPQNCCCAGRAASDVWPVAAPCTGRFRAAQSRELAHAGPPTGDNRHWPPRAPTFLARLQLRREVASRRVCPRPPLGCVMCACPCSQLRQRQRPRHCAPHGPELYSHGERRGPAPSVLAPVPWLCDFTHATGEPVLTARAVRRRRHSPVAAAGPGVRRRCHSRRPPGSATSRPRPDETRRFRFVAAAQRSNGAAMATWGASRPGAVSPGRRQDVKSGRRRPAGADPFPAAA
jgi:hypothetical protein